VRNILTSRTTARFPRRTLPHGVTYNDVVDDDNEEVTKWSKDHLEKLTVT
jgi:hypothetical protein